ncbi:methyl-accepting chemotaxis protein, partial [Bradyrhizobium sp. CCBAU 45389]|uniref:methyl-accepting chemotaxis protein n=1 Tax=Bradyrhizobium sp. CCBAU 45389 TaxID=858429 RepID=UPI0023059990
MPKFRLRIRGRLYAGFMALVAVGVVMAVVAVWNLRAVQDQVAKQSALSDSTARVLEISTHLQAIQRANLRYIYDASEPAMKEASERETAATELLKVGANGTASEERRKLYNDLIADIAKMKALRDNLGDAVNEARTGKATLLPSGDELTVKVGKLVDVARAAVDEDTAALVADLESRLLQVQIANWRFLALRDTKGPANFRTNVDRAMQRLSALEKSPQATELGATLAPVKTSLGIYKSAFETTSAAMLQADEIYHKNLAPLIVESIGKLKVAETTLKKDYKESRSAAEAVIEGTTSVQAIAGGLAVLFGLIVAFLIARSIVGPLTSMTRAMGLLAGGNLAVEIPGRGNRDEIGDMAKAIAVFKDNMVETERLRHEQVEVEARQAESRKADMVRLADQFEQAVGEIVNTVSSASNELEASAGTLTATASRAQDISTEVASASQEASANVQAVASATEELS